MKTNINQILETFTEFVSTHDYQNNPILSVYVDIDSTNPNNRREQPAWQIELKNELKRIESQLEPQEMKRWDNQKIWSDTEKMVMDYLESQKPTGRSVAVFTDFKDIIGVDLPVPMKTAIYYGLPQIKHLLFAMDQYKEYSAILFSGAEARMIDVFLTRSTNEIKVETDHELSRRFGRKSQTLASDRRDREFELRFIREMATEINQYFINHLEDSRIVFGGNLQQAAQVKNALNPAVKNLVVAIEPMDFKLADNEIAEIVRPIAYAYEQDHDVMVVENLVYHFNKNGTAVIEKQGVEKALSEARVKTLVIPYPMDTEEFDSLIVEVVLSGAQIEFVYGEGAEKLKQYGGIGAELYYSVR
jgi:Bacterial archaeo-eukaryotic release factor family 10